jgi:hypothetical protein
LQQFNTAANKKATAAMPWLDVFIYRVDSLKAYRRA